MQDEVRNHSPRGAVVVAVEVRMPGCGAAVRGQAQRAGVLAQEAVERRGGGVGVGGGEDVA
ncbi:hypothetical protein [Nonomuraea salmonea]|uniref:hypothetical protein n=1 Tax=Nonomuraea salmonea TaxID=46181 RepID=UPI002FEA52CD